MIRSILVLVVAATAALASVAGASVAQAEPPPPCSFTLSAPRVVQVGGADVVTATLAPAECGPPAAPYVSVACVQLQGDDSTIQCTEARGGESAQVFFSPYRPGAAYASTGRGCGSWIGTEPAPLCQQLGPTVATL
jgi:hypothetical protein